jgi:ketosteroid isomerase-like protein
MIHIIKSIQRSFAERATIHHLNVILLAVIAAGAGQIFMSLPCTAQNVKGLSEADIKKINETSQTATKAALSKDFTTWSALFHEDAVVYPPNEPAVKGRAAIRTWLEKLPPITEFTLNNEKIEGRQDLAYIIGTYTMTFAPPNAPEPVKDVGKFVTVLRKQANGSWLGVVDMFSSDLPPPPQPK